MDRESKTKLPNCWQICNCKNRKNCSIPKMGMGHSCWIMCDSMCCDHCKVYKLYNRETGSKGHIVEEQFPHEEEKYQKELQKRKLTN